MSGESTDRSISLPVSKPGKVLLIGEPMVLFTAKQTGDPAVVSSFSASIAGAELNVAVGLTRLRHACVYLSRIGADVLGERIKLFMQDNHIDTTHMIVDSVNPTGFMMKARVLEGDPNIYYQRKGSAASCLSLSDVDDSLFDGVSIFHFTGILPPLGAATRAMTEGVIHRCRKRGILISFDPNLRPELWRSTEDMRCEILRLASLSDIVLPGVNEGYQLFGTRSVTRIADAFIENGARCVIVKDGARGAYISNGNGGISVPGYVVEHVVDTVGAGDGFAVGVLSAVLEGLHAREALERGCAIGAMQTQSVSDNEGLPTSSEIRDFLNRHSRFCLADETVHSKRRQVAYDYGR